MNPTDMPDTDDLRQAEAAWRVAADAGDAEAMVWLGALLTRLGDLDGAEGYLRRAVEAGAKGADYSLARLIKRRADRAGSESARRVATETADARAARNLEDLHVGEAQKGRHAGP